MLLFMLSVSTGIVAAQQNHFIYLQTENKQAFYIKLDKKILSSSASGYLIIPRLQDGNYTLTLGFPKNEWPEQKVTCTVDKKDIGYVLKNFGDKGWGFFNWQSMNVVMAENKKEEQVAVVKKEEQPVKNTPSAVEEPKKVAPAEPAEEKIVKPAVTVTKLLSNKTADGIEMIFTDAVNNGIDTIRVFLAVERKETVQPAVKKEEPKQTEVKEEKTAVTAPAKEITKAEEKDNTATQQKVTPTGVPEVAPKPPVAVKEEKTVTNKAVIQNSDCKAFATEDDFMKLRKKMAAENNDDDMVNVARKIFKTKCFTVEQVKNISMLFLNDNGRYKFFDAAYPFVSDSYNFSTLEKLLSEEYYINRFKAMIHR